MSLKLGDIAPNFKAETTEGEIDFYEWLGTSWCVLLSHPADFTPVCTTELGKTAILNPEFKRRNVKTIAISVDSLESHRKWIKDINETQITTVNFPIIADPENKIALLYDMIHLNASEKTMVRSVFIIDPKKKIRLTLTYPASTGRNFREILRVIDSLQCTEYDNVATPADWQYGDEVIILPSITDDEAEQIFTKALQKKTLSSTNKFEKLKVEYFIQRNLWHFINLNGPDFIVYEVGY